MKGARVWHILVLCAAGLLTGCAVYFAVRSPIAGLVAALFGLWPLAIARISVGTGGCAVYPLMILPVWIAFPILWLIAAVNDEGRDPFPPSSVLFVCYYFFVMAAMLLALRYRFSKADNRAVVPMGEKVTISLIALAPLVLHACAYAYLAIEWLWTMVERGA